MVRKTEGFRRDFRETASRSCDSSTIFSDGIGEVARESVTERTEGKSEREEPGDLGREETISQPGKREDGKERATDDSTLGKQTEREISERPEMELCESTTDRTADEGPVSDRISGETERDGKLDREQTGNRQTISENRQDLPGLSKI